MLRKTNKNWQTLHSKHHHILHNSPIKEVTFYKNPGMFAKLGRHTLLPGSTLKFRGIHLSHGQQSCRNKDLTVNWVKKKTYYFPFYWLCDRDPQNGLLWSSYTLNNQGVFHCSIDDYPSSHNHGSGEKLLTKWKETIILETAHISMTLCSEFSKIWWFTTDPLVALSGIWTVGEKWYCIVSHGACSAVFIHDTWNPLLGCHSWYNERKKVLYHAVSKCNKMCMYTKYIYIYMYDINLMKCNYSLISCNIITCILYDT